MERDCNVFFIQVSISHEFCLSANVIAPNVRSEWLLAGITLEYRRANARVEGVSNTLVLGILNGTYFLKKGQEHQPNSGFTETGVLF